MNSFILEIWPERCPLDKVTLCDKSTVMLNRPRYFGGVPHATVRHAGGVTDDLVVHCCTKIIFLEQRLKVLCRHNSNTVAQVNMNNSVVLPVECSRQLAAHAHVKKVAEGYSCPVCPERLEACTFKQDSRTDMLTGPSYQQAVAIWPPQPPSHMQA